MDACVIEDEHEFLSIFSKLLLPIVIQASVLISQHVFKLFTELDKRFSVIDAYSHFCIELALIGQSTNAGCCWWLEVWNRSWKLGRYPRVWLRLSWVEGDLINPDESTFFLNEVVENLSELGSPFLVKIIQERLTSHLRLLVSMLEISLHDIHDRSFSHFSQARVMLPDIQTYTWSSDALSLIEQQSFFHSIDLFKSRGEFLELLFQLFTNPLPFYVPLDQVSHEIDKRIEVQRLSKLLLEDFETELWLLLEILEHFVFEVQEFSLPFFINPKTSGQLGKVLSFTRSQLHIWLSHYEWILFFFMIFNLFNNQPIWNSMHIFFQLFDRMKADWQLFASQLMICMLDWFSIMRFVDLSLLHFCESNLFSLIPNVCENFCDSFKLNARSFHCDY